jgi:hypothetical protein
MNRDIGLIQCADLRGGVHEIKHGADLSTGHFLFDTRHGLNHDNLPCGQGAKACRIELSLLPSSFPSARLMRYVTQTRAIKD